MEPKCRLVVPVIQREFFVLRLGVGLSVALLGGMGRKIGGENLVHEFAC